MLVKLGLIYALSSIAHAQSNPCVSFGVDYQDGGTYFQNILSNNPFTFVSTFEGCQADVANNILVDPQGNQYLCTNTNLTPANTPDMSTCPLNDTELATGPWSVIIISNNGNAEPIAYERDFHLTVGRQSTHTVTPTVIVNITSTPFINVTHTVTYTNVTSLPAATVTAPSITVTPTKLITPKPAIWMSTKVLYTVYRTIPRVTVSKVTKVVTATCSVPPRQTTPDKTCRIKPTVAHAAAFDGGRKSMEIDPLVGNMPGATPPPFVNKAPQQVSSIVHILERTSTVKSATKSKSAFDWTTPIPPNMDRFGRVFWARDLNDKPKFLAERSARLEAMGVKKRSPDQATVTVTNTNTAVWPTVTSTILVSTRYMTLTSTATVYKTVKPVPVTVLKGEKTAAQVVVTMPKSTRTSTKYIVASATTIKMITHTQIITQTATPKATMSACRKVGGWFGHGGWR